MFLPAFPLSIMPNHFITYLLSWKLLIYHCSSTSKAFYCYQIYSAFCCFFPFDCNHPFLSLATFFVIFFLSIYLSKFYFMPLKKNNLNIGIQNGKEFNKVRNTHFKLSHGRCAFWIDLVQCTFAKRFAS